MKYRERYKDLREGIEDRAIASHTSITIQSINDLVDYIEYLESEPGTLIQLDRWLDGWRPSATVRQQAEGEDNDRQERPKYGFEESGDWKRG